MPPPATSLPATLGDSIGGIYSKVLAIALFATMDAMVKALGERYPTLQLMFCRSLIGALPLLWLIQVAGGWTTLRTRQPAAAGRPRNPVVPDDCSVSSTSFR